MDLNILPGKHPLYVCKLATNKSKYGQQCGPWTTCLLFSCITWRLWLRVLMSCYMHICCSRSNGHILNMIIFSQRYDFTNKGSSSNVGLAYVSTMCSDQSVSVVEDHFDFTVLTSAAHELGHGYSIKTLTIVQILFLMCR